MREISFSPETCEMCSVVFRAKHLYGQKIFFCSKQCEHRYLNGKVSIARCARRDKSAAKARPHPERWERVTSGGMCIGNLEAYRASMARGSARRRSKMKCAIHERFLPAEIFERDGWRCKLCGCSTPKEKRGTFEPDSPELDHIFPIALGGAHTRDNVQLLCASCNRSKGASPPSERGLAKLLKVC